PSSRLEPARCLALATSRVVPIVATRLGRFESPVIHPEADVREERPGSARLAGWRSASATGWVLPPPAPAGAVFSLSVRGRCSYFSSEYSSIDRSQPAYLRTSASLLLGVNLFTSGSCRSGFVLRKVTWKWIL